MRIPVLVVAMAAAAAAAAGVSRPSRAFDASDYRDSPPFLDSPSSSRPSYFNPFLRHQHHYDDSSPTFYDDESLEPPSSSYHEGGNRVYFDSYFPPRRPPQTFYQDGSFGSAAEYRGPPPPTPSGDPQKLQQHQSPTSFGRDERLPTTKAYENPRTTSQQLQQQPTTTSIETRQPLSFGGHSSHLSYGDHSLGFASVAAITSAGINPLAIGEITSTTRAAPSTMPMHTTYTTMAEQLEVSQRQNTPPHPPPPPPAPQEVSSSVETLPPTPSPKITVSAPSIATQSPANTARLSESASTTPRTTTRMMTSVATKSSLDPVQNQLNQMSGNSMMMLPEAPKVSYEFRTISPELPASVHGQLPIESIRQQLHIPDIKHNLLIYDTKSNNPYYQPNLQINQQSNSNNNNNNNVPSIRFSIPTSQISTSLTSQTQTPLKFAIQGVDFTRSPVSFTAVPTNINTYASGSNQIDITQFNKLSPEINPASNLGPTSYYVIQNSEQSKPTVPVTSGTPLGSFLILPNGEQSKQAALINTQGSSGLQFQLGGLGGIEYFLSPSNSGQMKTVANGRDILNLQERHRSSGIEYQQNHW